jgi:hypothetical protein
MMSRNSVAGLVLMGILAGATPATAQDSADPHHPDQTPPRSGRSVPGMLGAGMGNLDMMGIMGGMMNGMMGGGMMGGGMMSMTGNCPMTGSDGMYTEGRLAFLKAELAITDGQKSVWDAYAAALKKSLRGMVSMQQIVMKVMQAKSPVERIDAQIAAMDGRTAALKTMKTAVQALYAALSADQKKKADELLAGMSCLM